MAGYSRANLKSDIQDMAPQFGMEGIEARFARKNLELEEIYVVVSGSARVAIGDEVLELDEWDAVRIPSGTMHAMEGGPDGGEILAFGAPNTDNKDAEMKPGWWPGND